jgi:hypothetical protein
MMTRLLTCLGMMSVLLLTFTVSTGFVSNGYQKVYAAADFPTSDLATKIREGINNQVREERTIATIMLSNFPHQTGESVTNVDVECFDGGRSHFATCFGNSNIAIPGIGGGKVSVDVDVEDERDFPYMLTAQISGLPGQTDGSHYSFRADDGESSTEIIDIPGIGTGQATVRFELPHPLHLIDIGAGMLTGTDEHAALELVTKAKKDLVDSGLLFKDFCNPKEISPDLLYFMCNGEHSIG